MNADKNAWQEENPERRNPKSSHAGLSSPIPHPSPVPNYSTRPPVEVVALAASAGGLQALTRVLAGLKTDFRASVVVVQHLDPRHRSMMAEILGRRTPLPVSQAKDGETLQPGHVYISPPDQHLLVNLDGTLSLTHTELVHFLRPSADLLFESVAASYKERAVAVVLSGTGMDGAFGVRAIKEMGGIVIAQDEKTAEFFGMPEAAIQTGKVDYILPLDDIAITLTRLVEAGKEEGDNGQRE